MPSVAETTSPLSEQPLGQSRPSAEKVSELLIDFVGAAFEHYYCEGGHSSDEALDKIVHYLDGITDGLRKRHKSKTADDDSKQTAKQELKNANVASAEKLDAAAESADPGAIALPWKPSLGEVLPGEDCRICLEPMGERRIGLLERCDHKYCETCLRTWMGQNPNQLVKCPTCRVRSAMVIFRSRVPGSACEKEAEFNSVVCCAPHAQEAEETSQDEDEEAVLDREDEDLVGQLINDLVLLTTGTSTDTTGEDAERATDPDFDPSTVELSSTCSTLSSSSSQGETFSLISIRTIDPTASIDDSLDLSVSNIDEFFADEDDNSED